LSFILWVSLVVMSSMAFAQGQVIEPEDDGRVRLRTRAERVHIPGLRWNIGAEGHDLGLGYLYALQMHYSFWELGLTARLGLGPDLTVSVGDFDGFNGLLGFGMGRVSVFSGSSGGGVEFGTGMGAGAGGATPLLKAGVFIGGEFFEIGYAYQHALTDSPVWLNVHNLTIRLNLPMFSH
jgi:hypothetical protein